MLIVPVINLLFLLSPVKTETQILDYSNAQSVAMGLGSAKIEIGVFKIIHVLELSHLQYILNIIQVGMNNVQKDNYMYPFLVHEFNRTQEHLERLIPKLKRKRSLDFIGSAWKFIEGNPDQNDFEIIQQKINSALQNNNQQVVINRATLHKINELSEEYNKIIKSLQNNKITNTEIAQKLKYELDIVKEDITNIEYAINWAKANIVNSLILSSKEINETLSKISKVNKTFINVEELFEFSKVKIASDGSSILYIISIPITKNENCEILQLKSFKRNNVINKTNFEKIIKCKNDLFGITSECNSLNKLTICNENNLINLENNTCIKSLLSSRNHNCTKINSQHVPEVELVLPGIILLNEFKGEIQINNETVNLKGNFIIKFENATILIKDKKFVSSEIVNVEVLPAILQPESKNNKLEEILSLEMMKELNINNTKIVSLLKTENHIKFTIIVLLITFLLVLASIKIIKKCCISLTCKRRMQNKSTDHERNPSSSTINETPETPNNTSIISPQENPIPLKRINPTPKITSVAQIPLF